VLVSRGSWGKKRFWVGNMDDRATFYTLPSAIQVFVNGASQGTFSNDNNTNNQLNWKQFSFNFAASTASNTILFQNATNLNDSEAGLDDVFIDVASPPVPEPSTFGLTVSALGVLGFGVWRRRLIVVQKFTTRTR
jgi:hypothetical protein